MKRRSISGIFALMLALTAGCAGEAEMAGDTEKSQTADDSTTIATYQDKHHADCSTPVAENEDGYYLYDGNAEQICYYERNEDIIVPLCSKTDCSHTVASCNAHVSGMSGTTLTLVGDKLYYVAQQGNEAGIYSTAADGTGGVEKIVTLCEVYGGSYGVTDGIFDRGYLYYVENEIDTEQDREYYNLYRIKVEGNAKPELLYQEKDESSIYNVLCYLKSEGDFIYFSNMVLVEDNYYGQIQRYNIGKGTVETVFSYEDGNTYNGRYEVLEDELYLVKTGGTVEIYDMETESLSEFYQDETNAETNCEIEFDGTYFYLDNGVEGFISMDQSNRQINVRDVDGKLVDSLELSGNMYEIYCAFENGIVYSAYEVGDDEEMHLNFYYADKSQIGSGKMEFTEVQN